MHYYKELEELNRQWKGKVCLFGAGLIGRTRGYDIVNCAGFQIDFYCDNNKLKQRTLINGIEVITPTELYTYRSNVLVFLTVSLKNQQVIEKQLQRNGINQIIILDDVCQQKMIEEILEENNKEVIEKWKVIVDDKEYLKRQFKYYMGYELDLDDPQTFNEKLQWLKLYDRNPAYIKMVDKYEVKKYISDKLGKEYVIPTLGIYDSVDEIDLKKLPQQFVLKCTHDSGSTIICKDKDIFNKDTAKNFLDKRMKINPFWLTREWPYKSVKPRIIAEKYLQQPDKECVKDYKIFCFNGVPKLIMTVAGGHDDERKIIRRMYSPSWELLKVGLHGKMAVTKKEDQPEQLDTMLEIAKKLSANIMHVRVDLYIYENQVLFGEMTFYHQSGYEIFEPKSFDLLLGSWLSLVHTESGGIL